MTAIYTAIAIVLMLLLAVAAFLFRLRRVGAVRSALMNAAFPDEYARILVANFPVYSCLPAELKKRLEGYVLIFLAEKRFEGCGGLEMTDEIRVTIAAQACLLLLGSEPSFYPKLKSILVYPSTYQTRQTDADGINKPSVRLGESWTNGPVVLSWNSVAAGARNSRDGRNVVFHEFAHQLDQLDGYSDGAPILASRADQKVWSQIMYDNFNRLRQKISSGRCDIIDDYGATNPAEFFAVITEAFFEKPRRFDHLHPDLYGQLKSFYGLDPISWYHDN